MASQSRRTRIVVPGALAALLLAGAGCSTQEVLSQGYVIDEQALRLVPVGSSKEQVVLSLGSPSTTATFDNDVFYYISQTRVRPVAFMQPRLVDQRILAIYFNEENRVERIANYGLEDGQVIDFISRTTATGGRDATFLGQILTDTGSSPAGTFDTSRFD